MFVNLQSQRQILPVQRNVGLHQQVHLDKDPAIVVQIARVLEGRSEGAETLHYISSAQVKEAGKRRPYFKGKQKKIVPMLAERQ